MLGGLLRPAQIQRILPHFGVALRNIIPTSIITIITTITITIVIIILHHPAWPADILKDPGARSAGEVAVAGHARLEMDGQLVKSPSLAMPIFIVAVVVLAIIAIVGLPASFQSPSLS